MKIIFSDNLFKQSYMKTVLNLFFSLLKMLADPLVLSLLLFFFILIAWKKNRFWAMRIGIMTLLSVIIITGNGIIGRLTAKYLQENQPEKFTLSSPSVIVVLGGGMTRLGNQQQPHIISYSRLVTAAILYQSAKQNNQPCKIITSGNGNPDGMHEATSYTRLLISMGIPESDIIIEDKSMNTYENAEYSSLIVKTMPPSKVYLVTSGFHIKRSGILFESFGINPILCPSDVINTELTVLPNSYNSAITSLMLGELVGILQTELYNALGLNNHHCIAKDHNADHTIINHK